MLYLLSYADRLGFKMFNGVCDARVCVTAAEAGGADEEEPGAATAGDGRQVEDLREGETDLGGPDRLQQLTRECQGVSQPICQYMYLESSSIFH